MRKILSLVLGLMWTLPVWGANCNLFDGTITHWAYTTNPNRVNVSSSYMGITLPVTENKTYTFSRATAVGNRFVRYFTTDVPVEGMAVYDVNSNISIDTLTHTFTVPAGMKYVVFYFDVSGADISNSKMQLEEGTTATAYTPYNPLCATCDGTVVNYTSATGTVSQNGTPTPTNPIEPTFYKQGNMILRKVGDYADSYDATTGKITRRVGVRVLNGTENWKFNYVGFWSISSSEIKSSGGKIYCTHFESVDSLPATDFRNDTCWAVGNNISLGLHYGRYEDIDTFKQWLADQYAAGTPVTVYYPLETETTEDWPASYCETPIKIATTKYNETAFGPLNTALQNAISVVDTVVSNTITQAGRIATLQAQKQTRPNDIADDNEKCPTGKKCLLVEDASGIPHWYEIVENPWGLPDGYIPLEYLRSDGRAYINTNYSPTSKTRIEVVAKVDYRAGNVNIAGSGRGTAGDSSNALLVINSLNDNTAEIKFDQAGAWIRLDNVNMLEKNRLSLSATKFSVNGDVKETNDTTIPDTDNRPFYIFQRWRPLIESTNNKVQIYEFSIYENDILVRNMIPVKRNSDGVLGMFDTVNDVFYTNAGDGEFIAGDPVSE